MKTGALYHVTARANRQEMILDSRGMKELFMKTLSRAKKKYRFRVENFCVMGNHFHLIIRPEAGESLSRILQWILSVFAMAYNRIHGLWGHVWGSRFFSRILAGLREYLAVFDYIDQNPLAVHRVRDPREWMYGGLWEHRHGYRTVADRPEPYVEMMVPDHGLVRLERVTPRRHAHFS
ncbi:MAG TPA: transposase [Spirochaetia bacterium]|nr:transposase [Spirochaetales bacterium]HRY79357.1 transposase [Spirochaetia bacterium]